MTRREKTIQLQQDLEKVIIRMITPPYPTLTEAAADRSISAKCLEKHISNITYSQALALQKGAACER